jgi:1-acyl-sn-glycerol-3-phosphate acyltransferase
MNRVRALWRLLRVIAHILGGVWTIRMVFPRLSTEQKNVRVQVWALEILARLAIKLVVRGQPPLIGPMLLVANHISWLDIAVMHAARHCRFVSKDDVQMHQLTMLVELGVAFVEHV